MLASQRDRASVTQLAPKTNLNTNALDGTRSRTGTPRQHIPDTTHLRVCLPVLSGWFRKRMLLLAMLFVIAATLPLAAQAPVDTSVLDRARQLGETLKSIQERTAAVNTRKQEQGTAEQSAIDDMRKSLGLLNAQADTIRRIYGNDKPAAAAIDAARDGRAVPASNAQAEHIEQVKKLGADCRDLDSRSRAAQVTLNGHKEGFRIELERLYLEQQQAEHAVRELKAPYLTQPDVIEQIDRRLLNAQGKQTPAQVKEAAAALAAERQAEIERKAKEAQAESDRKAKDALAETERRATEKQKAENDKREAPARQAITDVQRMAPSQLIGNFVPANAVEQDILAAAVMAKELSLLYQHPLLSQPLLQARTNELQRQLSELDQKHSALAVEGTPFRSQWRALSGEDLALHPTVRGDNGDTPAKLLPSIEALVAARIERDKSEQAANVARQVLNNARKAEEATSKVVGVASAVGGRLLIVLGILAVPVGGVWLLIRRARKRKIAIEAARAGRIAAAQQEDRDAWAKLGDTPETREAAIRRIFDDQKEILSFGTRQEYEGRPGYFEFRISRGLAAMEPREREFLRTTYLLRNAALLDKSQWNYFRFAFINGGGKASLDGLKYFMLPESLGIKDGPTLLKHLQDEWDASVDSAVNALLGVLQKLEKLPVVPAIVGQIKGRLTGGNAWLEVAEIADSPFAAGGKYCLQLGTLEGSGVSVSYSGEGSLITIAPPGAGKTQCFVIPNLLQWPGSAVVLDVKGEIFEATSKWRAEHVGPVYKFSPLDPATSHSYCPLSFIRQSPEFIWEDSRFLAEMLIVPSGAADLFWENMARDVVTAIVAHVCYENAPERRPMSAAIDLAFGLGWDEMIISLKTNLRVAAMRQMGAALGDMERKTRDSVLKTVQSSFSAWQGERVARTTAKSDWNPLDLRSGTPTIYICINPNEIDSYLSVLRVVIAQHIRMLTSVLPPRDSAPTLFVLDEMPRLKKMPPIDEGLSIGRQYGIRLWMFAQSFGQLEEAYANAEGMLGSCAVRTFMNVPLNDELAQKLSDQLGFRDGPLDNSRQKLVEPIELAGPAYRDLVLVLAGNTKPARVHKVFAHKDPALTKRMGRVEKQSI